MKRIRKAVIPAAGLGTRFLPASKAIPKEMLPIVDVPAIQLVVEEAVAAGIEQIVVVNGRHKSAIEDHFDQAHELETVLRERGKEELLERVRRVSQLAEVISVRQKQPLGLGHAVLCARSVVGDEPFAVLLPDDLFDGDEKPGIGQLCHAYGETGVSAIGVMEVPEDSVHLYGIVAGEADKTGYIRARGLVEKPAKERAPSRMAAIGRYLLSPDIWRFLADQAAGVGGEIQLTDALGRLAESSSGLYAVALRGCRYDAGSKLGYLEATLAYALKHPDIADKVPELLKRILNR